MAHIKAKCTRSLAIPHGSARGVASSMALPQETWRSLCGENRYTTTLHVLNSAVVKLGKLTRVEKAQTLMGPHPMGPHPDGTPPTECDPH